MTDGCSLLCGPTLGENENLDKSKKSSQKGPLIVLVSVTPPNLKEITNNMKKKTEKDSLRGSKHSTTDQNGAAG